MTVQAPGRADGPSSSGERALGVSVVVVTYNSGHCVGACLRSVEELLAPDEIVVVDNGSDDDSLEVVRRAAPAAVVVPSAENLGFGRACNLAVARARCEGVLFVNPDVVLVRADRDALGAMFARRPVGLVVPLLAPGPGSAPRHQIFGYRSWPRMILPQAWSHLRPRELDRPARTARSVAGSWAAAALLGVRRQEFLDAGGFDPRYFLYAEDLDLSRRYREHGLGLALTDSIVGHHSGSASSVTADSLRVAPLAWSLLGTLEFVSLWRGERAARRGAALALASLRLQRRLLRLAGRTPGLGERASRKRGQLAAIESFLAAHALDLGPADAVPYCPGAGAAVRSVLAGDGRAAAGGAG